MFVNSIAFGFWYSLDIWSDPRNRPTRSIAFVVFGGYGNFRSHASRIVPDSARLGAEAFQILGEINLSDPDPSRFIKVWLYDHPPLAERVVFAQQYDP